MSVEVALLGPDGLEGTNEYCFCQDPIIRTRARVIVRVRVRVRVGVRVGVRVRARGRAHQGSKAGHPDGGVQVEQEGSCHKCGQHHHTPHD